jgi:hypothetical protein
MMGDMGMGMGGGAGAGVETSGASTTGEAGIGLGMRRNLLGSGSHSSDIMTDVTHYIYFKNLFSVINGLINCLNTYICINQTKHIGLHSLMRLWSIVDIAIIILNTCICLNIFDHDYNEAEAVYKGKFISTVNMRVLEMFCVLFMSLKGLYYLQLVPEIAPLIDMMFEILG